MGWRAVPQVGFAALRSRSHGGTGDAISAPLTERRTPPIGLRGREVGQVG